MTRSPPWTDAENAALIGLYFDMLDAAMTGRKYIKAVMIRDAIATDYIPDTPPIWRGKLAGRTKQSVEFKLMNASACHESLDGNADTMGTFGYRAMPNYQAALKVAMQSELDRRYDQFNGDEVIRCNPVTGAY